jgi:flagellar motor protein MotB
MTRKRRLTENHDNVGWIAYTDFVTALALVFVALFVVGIANSTKDVTTVEGDIKNAAGEFVSDCEVHLDSIETDRERFTRSDREGGFNFVLDSLQKTTASTASKVSAECPGYAPVSQNKTLVAGERNKVLIEVGSKIEGGCITEVQRLRCVISDMEARARASEGIGIVNMGGNALFPPNKSDLTPEGEESLRDLARTLRTHEAWSDTTNVLAILGHTDDEPFKNQQTGVDFNWPLSAARAAAAARFLIELDPEYRCRIVAMGFGPSRPLEPVDTLVDDPATRWSKREENRRLEFRVLNGSDLSAGQPSDC